VIYHHYPIEAIHPFARDAAMAAECARDFGRFVQMNETLFDRQEQIGIASWGWFGAMAGLRDTAAFTACVRAQTDSQRIIADQRLGRSVPVRGTPTVFLNQWQLLGTPALALLDSVFARAIKPGQSKPY
jgi:protein-disulfide isomerase